MAEPDAGESPPTGMTSRQAQEQVDQVLAELRARAERVREQRATALAVSASASSADGAVRATVEATGVVTALEFAPSVFDRTTPDKLARTVVATIQAAAAQSRGRLAETWESLRGNDSGVLDAAARGVERLGVPRLAVPEVPRTATDPTGQQDQRRPADEADSEIINVFAGDDDNDRAW